jgi:dihydroorotase
MSHPNDLILAGGRVLDPASGRDEQADVAIRDGLITAIAPGLGRDAGRIIDCAGQYVTPGLIDSHSHIFAYVSKVGAPVDEAHLSRGVVAVADAGTAGASTFEAFRRYVAEPSRVRVLSFLNISVSCSIPTPWCPPTPWLSPRHTPRSFGGSRSACRPMWSVSGA